MNWVKVNNKAMRPKENTWYWVTTESFGFRVTEEAEFRNGKWYNAEHSEENVLAWYPVERPKPYLEKEETAHTDLLSSYEPSEEDMKTARKYFSDYVNEYNEKIDTISSKEYLEWLYQYLAGKESVSDEDFLYREDDPNRENSMLLSYLEQYIRTLTKVTYRDEEGWEHFVFQLRDRFFDISSMYGQGVMTFVEGHEPMPGVVVLLK